MIRLGGNEIITCIMCPAKSADCAHGDLRGTQSCKDTKDEFLENEGKCRI